jgi:hypothetical protein
MMDGAGHFLVSGSWSDTCQKRFFVSFYEDDMSPFLLLYDKMNSSPYKQAGRKCWSIKAAIFVHTEPGFSPRDQ